MGGEGYGNDMKTSELTGAALDLAVAKCEQAAGLITYDAQATGLPYCTLIAGQPCLWGVGILQKATFNPETGKPHVFHGMGGKYSPSTEWDQGGTIIEREQITVAPFYSKWVASKNCSENIHDQDGDLMTVVMWSEEAIQGPTPLIAAMRCYIASKLGDEVEIPEELT